MATLNEYLQQTQRFLREKKQDLINPQDLVSYINRARREVAMRTMQSVNCALSLQVSAPRSRYWRALFAGGTGYNASLTTVSITPPDFPSGTGSFPLGAQATGSTPIMCWRFNCRC